MLTELALPATSPQFAQSAADVPGKYSGSVRAARRWRAQEVRKRANKATAMRPNSTTAKTARSTGSEESTDLLIHKRIMSHEGRLTRAGMVPAAGCDCHGRKAVASTSGSADSKSQ